MPTCSRCNRNLGLLDKLGYNKQAQRCAKCDNEVRWALNQYRKQFLDACQDGIVTDAEWQKLTTTLTTANVNQAEALEYIRGDALNLLERTLTFAFADGHSEVHKWKDSRTAVKNGNVSQATHTGSVDLIWMSEHATALVGAGL